MPSSAPSSSIHVTRPIENPYLLPQVEAFGDINTLAEAAKPSRKHPPERPPQQRLKDLSPKPFDKSDGKNSSRKSSEKSIKASRSEMSITSRSRVRRATTPTLDTYPAGQFGLGMAPKESYMPTIDSILIPPRSSSLVSPPPMKRAPGSFSSQKSCASITSISSNTSLVRVAAAVAAISKRTDKQRRRSPTEGAATLDIHTSTAATSSKGIALAAVRRHHQRSRSVTAPIQIVTDLNGNQTQDNLSIGHLLPETNSILLSQLNQHDIPLTLPEISPLTPFIDDRRFSEGDSHTLADFVKLLTPESARDKNSITIKQSSQVQSSPMPAGEQHNHVIKERGLHTAANISTSIYNKPKQSAASPALKECDNNTNKSIKSSKAVTGAPYPRSFNHQTIASSNTNDDYLYEYSNVLPDAPNSTLILDSSCNDNQFVEQCILNFNASRYQQPSTPFVSQDVSLNQVVDHDRKHNTTPRLRNKVTNAFVANKIPTQDALVSIYAAPPPLPFRNERRCTPLKPASDSFDLLDSSQADISYASIAVEPPTPRLPVPIIAGSTRGASLDLDRVLEPFCDALFDANEFRRECVWMGKSSRQAKEFLFPNLARIVREGIEQGRFGNNEKAAQRMSILAAGLAHPNRKLMISRVTPWELSPGLLRVSTLRRARSDESLRATTELKQSTQRTRRNIARPNNTGNSSSSSSTSHRLHRNKRS
ncbi:hypothetical protein BDF19DRAFT_421867 [Syncephalis fuscata]|nr:hypothetical protein BDF19DRAFT_421867 [Syncephalis fuscata]